MGLVMVLRGMPVIEQQSQRPAQTETFALPRRQTQSGSYATQTASSTSVIRWRHRAATLRKYKTVTL